LKTEGQKLSKKQEKQTEKALKKHGFVNPTRTPGSGNKSLKGDVITDTLMIECKITSKEQIGIKRDYITKLIEESIEAEKEPVFEFGFSGISNFVDFTWMAVPKSRMEELFKEEKTTPFVVKGRGTKQVSIKYEVLKTLLTQAQEPLLEFTFSGLEPWWAVPREQLLKLLFSERGER